MGTSNGRSSAVVESSPGVSDELERRIATFFELLDRMKKRYRWTQPALLKFSAVPLAAIRCRPDEMEDELERVSRVVQEDASFFSGLHSARRFLLAAILLSSGEEPKKSLKEMRRIEERLEGLGFRRGYPAMISALILFLGSRGKAVGDEAIRKALALWEKMKERHWFTTDRDDLPMAALLTSSTWDVETIDERLEAIYQGLLRARFSRGSSLQFAAHVLTLSRLEDEVIVRRFSALAGALKQRRYDTSRDAYDEISLLTLLPGDEASVVEAIDRIVRSIGEQRGLRWQSGVGFSLSVGLLLGTCLERGPLLGEALTLGLLHNAEMVLQAQAAGVAGFGSSSLAAAS